MSYSNVFFKNNKMIVIVLISFLVSSCTSFQPKENKKIEPKSDTKARADRVDSNKNLGGDLSADKIENSVSINDPMANIQINSEIKKAYKQAASYIKQKKYPNALNLMIKIKGKYPQLSGPNYQMARIYLLQKQYIKALEQADASLQKNPRNYYSMSLKGVILKTKGSFNEAKSSYLKAIDIYPNYSKSHLNLGVLADVYLGDLDLALSEYKTYMALTSNKDRKVANWVLEVERRLKSSK